MVSPVSQRVGWLVVSTVSSLVPWSSGLCTMLKASEHSCNESVNANYKIRMKVKSDRDEGSTSFIRMKIAQSKTIKNPWSSRRTRWGTSERDVYGSTSDSRGLPERGVKFRPSTRLTH